MKFNLIYTLPLIALVHGQNDVQTQIDACVRQCGNAANFPCIGQCVAAFAQSIPNSPIGAAIGNLTPQQSSAQQNPSPSTSVTSVTQGATSVVPVVTTTAPASSLSQIASSVSSIASQVSEASQSHASSAVSQATNSVNSLSSKASSAASRASSMASDLSSDSTRNYVSIVPVLVVSLAFMRA